MQNQMSVITLGVAELARSRRFYTKGFGWKPVFANEEIIFYQMNGFMLATWLARLQEGDMKRANTAGPAAFALAHNVATHEDVQPTMDQLLKYGGKLLKAPEEPPHGGFSGYLADPDDHAWEIAFNPSWTISEEGYVKFGV